MKELIFKGTRRDGQEVIFNLTAIMGIDCEVPEAKIRKMFTSFRLCYPETVRKYINFDDCDGDAIFEGDEVIVTCKTDGEIFRDKYLVYFDYEMLGYFLKNPDNPKGLPTAFDGIDQEAIMLARKVEDL